MSNWTPWETQELVLVLTPLAAHQLDRLATFVLSDGWWIPFDPFDYFRELYDEYILRSARIVRTHTSLKDCSGWSRFTICDRCDAKFSRMEYGKETRAMYLELRDNEFWNRILSPVSNDDGFDPMLVMAQEVIEASGRVNPESMRRTVMKDTY